MAFTASKSQLAHWQKLWSNNPQERLTTPQPGDKAPQSHRPGARAIENGHGLGGLEDFRKARAEHNLDRRMKVYLAPKVLVVDEFGMVRPGVATAFFTLVSARYERGSIILTSNKGRRGLLGDS